jgi:hypothetical protein
LCAFGGIFFFFGRELEQLLVSVLRRQKERKRKEKRDNLGTKEPDFLRHTQKRKNGGDKFVGFVRTLFSSCSSTTTKTNKEQKERPLTTSFLTTIFGNLHSISEALKVQQPKPPKPLSPSEGPNEACKGRRRKRRIQCQIQPKKKTEKSHFGFLNPSSSVSFSIFGALTAGGDAGTSLGASAFVFGCDFCTEIRFPKNMELSSVRAFWRFS